MSPSKHLHKRQKSVCGNLVLVVGSFESSLASTSFPTRLTLTATANIGTSEHAVVQCCLGSALYPNKCYFEQNHPPPGRRRMLAPAPGAATSYCSSLPQVLPAFGADPGQSLAAAQCDLSPSVTVPTPGVTVPAARRPRDRAR